MMQLLLQLVLWELLDCAMNPCLLIVAELATIGARRRQLVERMDAFRDAYQRRRGTLQKARRLEEWCHLRHLLLCFLLAGTVSNFLAFAYKLRESNTLLNDFDFAHGNRRQL